MIKDTQKSRCIVKKGVKASGVAGMTINKYDDLNHTESRYFGG